MITWRIGLDGPSLQFTLFSGRLTPDQTRDYSLYSLPPAVPAVPGSRTPLLESSHRPKPPRSSAPDPPSTFHSNIAHEVQHDNGQPRVDEQSWSPTRTQTAAITHLQRLDWKSRSISGILPSPSLSTSSGCMQRGQIMHNSQSRM